MPSINYSVAVSGGGGNINQTVTRTAPELTAMQVPLAVGIAGTLSTRTSGTAGVLTVPTGHGITTANTIDIYWGIGSANRAYGCVVTAVTSTTITFDDANGASLPSSTTAIVVSPQVTVNLCIRSAGYKFFAIEQSYLISSETASSHVDFQTSGASSIISGGVDMAANTPVVNDVAGGTAAIFGSVAAGALVSNGSSANAATFNVTILQDPTL